MRINFISSINGVTSVREDRTKSDKIHRSQTGEKINQISNVHYKPLSFGRTWAEHKSWGAVINPETKEASFKLFTYPDTQKVTVTVEKTGDTKEKAKEFELKNKGSGVFEIDKIPAGEVKHGDKYFYTIYRENYNPVQVKDPYSFRQEDFMGKSTVYDHSLYNWNDNNWKRSKKRISRLANSRNGLIPVKSARIYEFNTATLTKGGKLEDVKEKLDEIKKLGFNAIEIMPVENTYSFNWGYDGVDKMAPAEHIGGPDQLKDLVDTAHQNGINVIMDMVPNHLGPDGAQLRQTGPYISHSNDFGDAFNFEGPNSRYVRDYMVNAALNWIDNYHCDGIRFDMTKYMESDYTMKQIAAEINYHKPDAFLIAEDARDDWRVTQPLRPEEYGKNQSEKVHADAIDKISNNQVSIDNLGFDSEWDFKYFHNLKELLYGSADFSNFEYAGVNSIGKVKYVMSHDEIGNFDGTRLISKLMVPELRLSDNIDLTNEDKSRAGSLSGQKDISYEKALGIVHSQKAQLTAEKLAVMLETGNLDKYTGKDYDIFADEVLIPLSIKYESNLYLDTIKNAYKTSYEKAKMAQALTYAIPGPKMIFQGDEKADLTPFRFFRQFDSIKDEQYLYVEKGYQHGKAALEESKIGNIPYSKRGQAKLNAFSKLTKDLNTLSKNNSAMTDGYVIRENTFKDFDSKVIGIHTKSFDDNNSNELFTVTNINSRCRYPDGKGGDKYYINFPEGIWVEVLNTNDVKYGGNGKYMNEQFLSRNENNQCHINLNASSTAIFKRVG